MGVTGFFGFIALDILWMHSGYRAYQAARARNFREHQAWMIRNFALTYAAVTLRVLLVVLIAVQVPFKEPGGFEYAYDQAYGAMPYLAWIPNIVIAELMIRRRGLPALRMTDR